MHSHQCSARSIFRFDYFARTVPPDTFQSIALVDVVKSANWSYVSTVYSEGSYGESGIEVFTREATERNVCIAAALKVPSAADNKVFDDIIQRLSKKSNARAIVLFVRAEDARGILEAARRSNLSQPFQVGGGREGREVGIVVAKPSLITWNQPCISSPHYRLTTRSVFSKPFAILPFLVQGLRVASKLFSEAYFQVISKCVSRFFSLK